MDNLYEMLNSNFTPEVKNNIYNNINIAIIALKQILSTNNDFFNYTKFTSIFGQLQSYAVERQLFLASSLPSSGYVVDNILVNNYGFKVSVLKTSDFICSIGRPYKNSPLLNKSNYKVDFSKGNYGVNSNQLMLDLNNINLNDKFIPFIGQPKYAQILYYYDFNNNEFKQLKIVVPDSSYKVPLTTIDILDLKQSYKDYTNTEQEELLPRLKEELLVKLQKDLG